MCKKYIYTAKSIFLRYEYNNLKKLIYVLRYSVKKVYMVCGTIYVIKYKLNDEYIYVGSTIRDIKHRWKEHLREYNKTTNQTLLYQKMRETNDIENWYIEIYAQYDDITQCVLLQKEEELIKAIGTLNTVNNRSQYIKEYKYKQKQHQKIADMKMKEGDIQYIHTNTAFIKSRLRILILLNSSPDYGGIIKQKTIEKYNIMFNKNINRWEIIDNTK